MTVFSLSFILLIYRRNDAKYHAEHMFFIIAFIKNKLHELYDFSLSHAEKRIRKIRVIRSRKTSSPSYLAITRKYFFLPC